MKTGQRRIHVLAAILLATTVAPDVGARKKEPFIDASPFVWAFHDLDGRTVRSTDAMFEGKVLLLDLWATWCPPCTSEIPTFIDLQERLADRGLVIVAVAFEDDALEPGARRELLKAFVEQRGITYLVLDGQSPQDTDEAFPGLENVTGFPVEILVGRDGKPVDVRNGYGYKKRWARELETELIELLDARGGGSHISTPRRREGPMPKREG